MSCDFTKPSPDHLQVLPWEKAPNATFVPSYPHIGSISGIEVLICRPQDATVLAFVVIFITFILWRDAGEMECSKRNLLWSQRLPFLQTGHQGLVLGLLLFFVCSVPFCCLFLLLFLLAIQNLLFAFCLNKGILVNLMVM
jgi:hypothetical protein